MTINIDFCKRIRMFLILYRIELKFETLVLVRLIIRSICYYYTTYIYPLEGLSCSKNRAKSLSIDDDKL